MTFSAGDDEDYVAVSEIFSELPPDVKKASLIQGDAQHGNETSRRTSSLGQVGLPNVCSLVFCFLVQMVGLVCEGARQAVHVLNLGHGTRLETAFHVREGLTRGSFMKGFRETFAAALKVRHVSGRQAASSPGSCELGSEGTGILDTGAIRTVIGEQKVASLLQTLPEWARSKVYWHESQTVFRFGNNDTLRAVGALFVPLGTQWLKIEVVSGNTPFSISNAFLRAFRATIDMSTDRLRIPTWQKVFELSRNGKGLFVISLRELVVAAARCSVEQRGDHGPEEIVTHVDIKYDPPLLAEHPLSDTHTAAEVAQHRVPDAIRSETQDKVKIDGDSSASCGLSREDAKSWRPP